MKVLFTASSKDTFPLFHVFFHAACWWPPLRNKLNIPWEEIKKLDTFHRVRVQQLDASLGPSTKETLTTIKPAPPASIVDKGMADKQSKQRKVKQHLLTGQSQRPCSRSYEKKKQVQIDHHDIKEGYGEDVRVKVEDMHIEVHIIFYKILLVYNHIDTKCRCNRLSSSIYSTMPSMLLHSHLTPRACWSGVEPKLRARCGWCLARNMWKLPLVKANSML